MLLVACYLWLWIAVFTCGLVFEMAKLFDCFSKATETTEVDGK